MNQPEKSHKQIVSKAEYVAVMSKKASLSFSGTVFLCTSYFAILCGLALGLTLSIMGVLVMTYSPLGGAIRIGIGLGLGFVIIRGGMFFSNRAEDILQKAEGMNVGVPFTQANTAHLPASESLVRASSEPEEEQQSVLLRASIHSQQTPAEQLLRPVD
jgi:hypothetical protein